MKGMFVSHLLYLSRAVLCFGIFNIRYNIIVIAVGRGWIFDFLIYH